MKERVFFDTNIFIYLYSEDETQKQNISQRAVDKYDCVISTQVLNEFSNICLGKLKRSSEEVALAIDEIIEQCTLLVVEEHTIKSALKIHSRYKYTYFDSLMIASALNFDCKYIMTEDLADGQVINDKLTIVNIYSEQNIVKYLDL
ncbi:MAG: PIN domain-containing protein [Chitinivibrionia bacterium]|nr:PIN domain-containing protein [Chitinivibrionia bacterium]